MELLDTDSFSDLVETISVPFHRKVIIYLVGWGIRPPTAELIVEEECPVAIDDINQRCEVIVGRTGTAMQSDEDVLPGTEFTEV